ncbi:polyamine-transporting ATPase 13A3 [Halyomorpha halys]|uniref:polyamine-transporting ATPase 13A3 n=1 Tax=Halyomorpha halys TaxID=286706 RepID=UPI0006D4CB78|nr:probable cation-transporting ATPase 13A3 [Halyomorpha halys]XP_014273142.1 probable cation-transporting ATPase 13A3 [Halyomorpha halys]
MLSTPKSLKLGFYRNPYNRVSFVRNGRNDDNIRDGEPLRDVKEKQQNGKIPGDIALDYINYGSDDEMEVQGFIRDQVRTVVSWIFIFLTLGGLRLVFHWWPHWMLYATHRRSSLDVAEKVLVIERYQQKHKCYYVKNIKTITSENVRNVYKKDDINNWDQYNLMDLENWESAKLSVHTYGGMFRDMENIRMFNCKKMTYIWDPDQSVFYKLRGLDCNVTSSVLHQQKGLSISQQYFRRAVYGMNEIIVPMRSVMALLFLEVLNPFYIFQIFSFTLWIVDNYVYYALCILAMSCCSIVIAVMQTRKNQINLWSRVHSRDVTSVLRGGEVAAVPTEQLVPGDVLVLPPHGCIMHCDAVLLAGNCIVNESMLTGESVPVTKTPMPNSPTLLYNEKEHARHTLFCGTQVIQTRYYGHERVYAVVIRTSFSTAKGNLVRSILYPPPVDFKFERDSYKFVQILAAFAAIGVLYTIISKVMRGNEWSEITLEALDLITIVVPPALPAAMTVGRMYAQKRLENANIFCISPRTINVSGSINCVCFDKTGTLTEDGLDMWGVVPVSDSKFQLPVKNIRSLPCDQHFLKAMVTCHGITMIDGNLAGDPLDIKMFESTGWLLEEPEVSDVTKFDLISPTVVKPGKTTTISNLAEDSLEVGIIRQFPFSSSLQRMSVITRRLGAGAFTLYCKGSPEMIQSLCDNKTVPSDFETELEEYTREGYRVLGLAYKQFPSKLSYAKMQRLSREEAETDLVFLGLVVMENRLKPETSGVLHLLRDAKIRTVMVTGDNMLTALSVARDCGIVPHGQRVIMVHTANNQSSNTPVVYFTQSNTALSPADTVHVVNEMSQITNTESITSLQTLDSMTVSQMANGTARNSIITDLPIDNTIEEGLKAEGNDYSFALTGSTWTVLRSHYPDLMNKVARRGAVFARMSPDHKQQLVQTLQTLDYFVAMVGDGANDCGALKAAHAGISLSEAESSVASPFTSRDPNISCIVEVIREGRAALVTSFAIFKYMAAYSLMQFASVLILYSIDNNLTDVEFLYIDLFVITTFAFVLGRVEAFRGPLYPKAPQSSLISLAPVLSLLGQMMIAVSAQLFGFYYVQHASWYDSKPNNTAMTDIEGGYENYSVFTISSLQYIILALIFSKGAPYRKSLLSTPGMVCLTVTITVFTLYLILSPCSWLISSFELAMPPSMMFRILMIIVGIINLLLAFTYEFVCDHFQEFLNRLFASVDMKHEEVERELMENNNWPEITTEPPPVETSPKIPRPTTTVTFVTPQPVRKLSIRGKINGSESHLEEKFSTPMRSILSLSPAVGQSEDSLSGYLTPPTSPLASPSH